MKLGKWLIYMGRIASLVWCSVSHLLWFDYRVILICTKLNMESQPKANISELNLCVKMEIKWKYFSGRLWLTQFSNEEKARPDGSESWIPRALVTGKVVVVRQGRERCMKCWYSGPNLTAETRNKFSNWIRGEESSPVTVPVTVGHAEEDEQEDE